MIESCGLCGSRAFSLGNAWRKVLKRNDCLGLAATVIFAIACIGAGAFLLLKILRLTGDGLHAEARVVAIERGAKSSKWPVYEFATANGREVRARDLTQRMFAPIERGDTVPVLYDPANPSLVAADLGIWLWRGPVIFFAGSVFLSGLGVAIWLHGRRNDQLLS